MICIWYALIVLLATMFGAIAGLGGGVFIKPLFDLIGYHSTSAIGFYSSVTVFTMCIVSISKQLQNGFLFNYKISISIAIGSLIGGAIGDILCNDCLQYAGNQTMKLIQTALLIVTFIVILVYTYNKDRIKNLKITSYPVIVIAGFLLGMISVFLGIGGGPLHVALLMYLFSYDAKEAAVYSITTIFFSQISKIGNVLLTKSYQSYDMSIVPILCIVAIIGGFIGSQINHKLESDHIEKLYMYLLVFLVFVSICNIVILLF